MSERKAIYYPNLDEILAKLQQTEYPWMDVGPENKNIIIAWCQDHGVTTLDFQATRAAIHNLGPSALESKKPSVAAPPPPPAPAPVRAPRFDWTQFVTSGKALPLLAPDGTRCPPEVLQRCTSKQVTEYVRLEEREKKPWLSGYPDSALRR